MFNSQCMIAPIKLRIFFTINYLIVNSYKKQCSISNRLPFFSINYLPVTVKHKSLQTGTNNADKWLVLNKLPLVLFCHILILSEHWPLNTSFTVLVLQHNIDHTNFNFNFNFNFDFNFNFNFNFNYMFYDLQMFFIRNFKNCTHHYMCLF